MLLPLVASAQGVEIDGICYNLNAENKTAEVTWNPNYYFGEVAIPESVTYEEVAYSVTSIGEYAFSGCKNLSSVTIPNSVTSILFSAFEDCTGLTSITIPNSVTSVRFHAFEGTVWYDNQPDGLVYAGSCVYKYKGEMPNNTTVSIKEGTTCITDGAFDYCNGLTSITIPNSLTFIGNAAFNGCSGLTSVTIPNSVASIGSQAFMGCSGLTSVTISNSVTSIGGQAFMGCSSLTSIGVDADNTYYDSRDNCNAIIETASNTLIVGCKTTAIPNSVTSIGESAFSGCGGLISFTIPNSVTSIGDGAFRDCSGLTSVVIPNSVTSIGSQAFMGCSGLTSVTIPNSVTSIEYSAFEGCSGLTSVIIPDKVTSIGERAFSYCINLTSLVVESGNPVYDSRDNCNAIIETAINTLIAGCKTTVIPNTVTSIGKYAFSGCSSLTSVTIPNSITAIVDGAFSGCGSLTSLTIPNSVTSIGYYVFEVCSSLTSVTSLAQTPPFMRDGAFTNYDIPLYVPKGTRDAYLAASPWNKFKEIIEIEGTDEDEITIKEIGKTTWCSEYDLDFTSVEGIKAYTATGYNNITKTIWLTRVMEVPAGTGILVKGDAGTYKIPHAEVQSAYANWFVGNLGETISISETDGDKTNYYLSGKDGTFVSVNGSANIGKNKAYLQLPTSVFGGTRSIGISYDDEDGTTSIKSLSPVLSEGEGEWYTLQGQRVAKPGKGLYIHNGKKVIVR